MTEKEIEGLGLPEWAMGMGCAITACDAEGKIIYMNQRSQQTFAKRGGAALIGHSLFDYHGDRASEMIRHMLATGDSNCYTIEKEGQRKMIYQTPWRDSKGEVGGLVELSMVIPENPPHYIRS